MKNMNYSKILTIGIKKSKKINDLIKGEKNPIG
jgi:hypothetical protein